MPPLFHFSERSTGPSKQITKGSERMKQIETNKLLRRFKQAFSEETITEIGRATGFFKRERKMTPMKMM